MLYIGGLGGAIEKCCEMLHIGGLGGAVEKCCEINVIHWWIRWSCREML